MTNDSFLGNLQVFGDVKQTPLDYACQYYRLNAYQRKTVRWIALEHLVRFCDSYGVNPDEYRSVITVSRAGFNKITQLITVTAVMLQVFSDTLQLKVVEVRHITIGKRGGMRLTNPARRGTVPHGTSVLVVKPDMSLMDEPNLYKLNGATTNTPT